MGKKIFIYFISWKLLIICFAIIATLVFPLYNTYLAKWDFGLVQPYLVWIWGNFDGTHYMEIARNGYHAGEYPFFPLYPVLIKLLFIGIGTFSYIPYLVSAQVISNVAFLFCLYVLIKLFEIDKKQYLAGLFLLVLLTYPTSFFYGAVYNDSLFFLFALLTIYFARKRAWIFSGVSGALATLTRLNGLALFFVILFEYLNSIEDIEKRDWSLDNLIQIIKTISLKKIIRSHIYFILLIPLTFLGYLMYNQLFHKSWRFVFSSMEVWGQQSVTFPLQVFWRYFKIIVFNPAFHLTYFVAIIELIFVLFYIAMMIYSYKKIRFSYWIFFVLSIIIPSLTGTFQGMPRYGLHIFPFFLAIALFLENKTKRFRMTYFVVSVVLLFICLGLFTRGYFIS